MTDQGRDFDEVALFSSLGHASVSFAFDLTGKGDRSAFRLVALSRHLEASINAPDDEAWPGTPHAGEVQRQLIDPVRSFLDDVTNGAPGVNGRPLLVLASGADKDSESRAVTLVRQSHWDYHYEGERTRMHVPESARRTGLLLRDSFCVFESGRIFYVLTLVVAPGERLDEYALLQLEQLSLDRELAVKEGYIAFEPAGSQRPLSLVAFVNARLARLNEPHDGDPRNAVVHLLKPYGLVDPDAHLGAISSAQLANLCIGIEDEAMQRAAEHAFARYDRARAGPAPRQHGSLAALERDWTAQIADRGIARSRQHRQPGNPIVRPHLVIAGLATGVPDFPFQDESEVHDSTRRTSHSVESALFTHPRFMLEVGRSWRSFREGQAALGTCPYLYLTWMVSIHDERTVTDMELMLEDMIYDPDGSRDKLPWSRRARAEPLGDVMQLLRSASNAFGHKTGVQERNLRQRLEIFRWESIHRCGNMFRYPKEKEALNAVREAMGTGGRFDEVHATLDRLENLVEDVSTLAGSYSSRYTNRLLGALTLLGVLGIPSALAGFWATVSPAGAWELRIATTLVVIFLAALYFVRRSGAPRQP